MITMFPVLLLTAAALGVLGWTIVVGPDPSKARVSRNLQRGLGAGRAASAAQLGIGAASQATSFLARFVPKQNTSLLEKLWLRAGRPPEWPLDKLVSAKILLTVVGLVFAGLVVLNGVSGMPLFAALGAPVLLYFVPDLLLHSRGIERREQITLELADTLDQMSIAVEAGLGFDAAMVRVAKNGQGVLAQELIRTLQDIQVGQTRRQAYEDLAERTQVPDLKQFIRSIVQAEAYGLALAGVLNTQAAEMRKKRRQRAEHKAMQIPVKVVIPLMVCILPVLFMVVMGPGVIRLIETFSQ